MARTFARLMVLFGRPTTVTSVVPLLVVVVVVVRGPTMARTAAGGVLNSCFVVVAAVASAVDVDLDDVEDAENSSACGRTSSRRPRFGPLW